MYFKLIYCIIYNWHKRFLFLFASETKTRCVGRVGHTMKIILSFHWKSFVFFCKCRIYWVFGWFQFSRGSWLWLTILLQIEPWLSCQLHPLTFKLGEWHCTSIAYCSEPLSSVKCRIWVLWGFFSFLTKKQKIITCNQTSYTKVSWTESFSAIRCNYTPVSAFIYYCIHIK